METQVQSRERPVRVLIADDHPMVRQGLRTILDSEARFEVCAEADSGRDAVLKARTERPDIALVDISMPGMNGIEATRIMLKTVPGAEVLILTQCDSEELIDKALQAGARGFMLKSDAGTDLLCAIDSLAQHRPFFTSRAGNMVLRGYLKSNSAGSQETGVTLTAREREIVQLLAEGNGNKEVAAAQGISVKTAETHRANIMKKLKVDSICGIVHYAVRNGIVAP